MEVAPRRAILALVAASILVFSTGCDELQTKFSGKKDQGPQLTALRKSIASYRARFLTAVSGSEMGDVSGLLSEGNRLLDSVEQQAALMSFMDGQAVKIDVASGRTIITAARGFAESSDMDGVRSHREKLDGVLFDIDSILDRAAMMTDNPPPAGS
jgi:hypothetical protein